MELEDVVSRLCPDWVNVGGFEYLTGGFSNDNYRFLRDGQSFVLRLPFRSRQFVDREHEAAVLRSNLPVMVPELIVLEPMSGMMITRHESGELLANTPPTVTELITYLKSFRDMPVCGRDYDPLLISRSNLARGIVEPFIDELAHSLRWHPDVLTPCHNDLNPWNVIRGPEDFVTLDWEIYGNNDPLFDIVTLHQGLGMSSAELAVIAADVLEKKVPPARLRHVLLVFWLREHAWAHGEWEAGNRRPEISEQKSISRRRLEELTQG